MKTTLMILWLAVIAGSLAGSAIMFLYSWRESERSGQFENTRRSLQDMAAPGAQSSAHIAGTTLSTLYADSAKNFRYVGVSSMLTSSIATVAFVLQFRFRGEKRKEHHAP